jgi:hypothetical protein
MAVSSNIGSTVDMALSLLTRHLTALIMEHIRFGHSETVGGGGSHGLVYMVLRMNSVLGVSPHDAMESDEGGGQRQVESGSSTPSRQNPLTRKTNTAGATYRKL